MVNSNCIFLGSRCSAVLTGVLWGQCPFFGEEIWGISREQLQCPPGGQKPGLWLRQWVTPVPQRRYQSTGKGSAESMCWGQLIPAKDAEVAASLCQLRSWTSRSPGQGLFLGRAVSTLMATGICKWQSEERTRRTKISVVAQGCLPS